ncbi:MAG: hypothetical protein KC423_09790 [Anaerolineales bacterium]|nr:hypothetical protein [Anaerolineales bacterium]
MTTALEKVRRLEKYLTVDQPTTNPVFDLALDKLLTHEKKRLQSSKERLTNQLREFEQQYHLSSQSFYPMYERGEMGDDLDYIEWASTMEMITNIEKRLALLEE